MNVLAETATLDMYQIQVTNRIVGSGQIIGQKGTTTVSDPVNAAIAASGAPIDPQVLATGTTGINVFANGIDTSTKGADLVFDFPQEYAFGKVVWSIGAPYNDTVITRNPGTPALLAGGVPQSNELYDPQALSDLTSANPKYVLDFGALYPYEKLAVNLVEKVYGPSSEYENDDGDNGGAGAGSYPACTPKGGAFICPGGFDYFESKIGVQPITNLDISHQMKEHVKFSIGAINLFNKFPGRLNALQQAHEDSFKYGDNAGVDQYPTFSPFGINGGFYYVKATIDF